MFEKIRKKLDEDSTNENDSGGVMEKERPKEFESPEIQEFEKTSKSYQNEGGSSEYSNEQTRSQPPELSSEIGIGLLMDKRTKLEEAVDYVGVMIKHLKDKRTNLEKEIEDESVDIKNLKEKLVKVTEYIDEENAGIQNLIRKRSLVEKEADGVGSLINELRDRLGKIDQVVDEEGNRIKSFKETRPKTDDF